MPIIYHYQQPVTVTQERYDRLITREGWYAAPTIPPLGTYKSTLPLADEVALAAVQANVAQNTTALNILNADSPASGTEILPRRLLLSNMGMTSGLGWFAFFTARMTQTVTAIRTVAGAASATPTTAKVALYTVAANGAGTRVAISPNDTTMWSVANAPVTRAFTSGVGVTAGNRYAIGFLFVGTTPPQLKGDSTQSGTELAAAPRMSGQIGSLTDLPASFVDADFTVLGQFPYAVLVP